MRVVLDCRSVYPGMGGIGRCAAALARELPLAAPEDEFVLLAGSRAPDRPLASAPNAKEVRVDAAMLDPLFEQVRLPGLLEEVEADIYHGTCFSVPISCGRAKRVATVHDVVFRRRPELVPDGLRSYLDRWTGVSCELADEVLTVSEFSKSEIRAVYGAEASVISNGIDERFFTIERRPPDGPPFVLYVGALEPKKNVARLIDAFARVPEPTGSSSSGRDPSRRPVPMAVSTTSGMSLTSTSLRSTRRRAPSATSRSMRASVSLPSRPWPQAFRPSSPIEPRSPR